MAVPLEDIVDIRTEADVTPAVLEAAVDCAFGADGIGFIAGIDWQYAYDTLESVYGYFIVEMDCPADRKIRAEVRRQKRAGRSD